jgi:hypothetical protein
MSVAELARLFPARYEGEGCGSRLGGCDGTSREGVEGVERAKLKGTRQVPWAGDTRGEDVPEPIPLNGGGRSDPPAPRARADTASMPRSVPPASGMLGLLHACARHDSYRSEEGVGSWGEEQLDPPARMWGWMGEPHPQGELTPEPGAVAAPGRRLHEASRLERRCIDRIPFASWRFS